MSGKPAPRSRRTSGVRTTLFAILRRASCISFNINGRTDSSVFSTIGSSRFLSSGPHDRRAGYLVQIPCAYSDHGEPQFIVEQLEHTVDPLLTISAKSPD